jgi:hypothetical protein
MPYISIKGMSSIVHALLISCCFVVDSESSIMDTLVMPAL